MDTTTHFYETIQKEMALMLATSADGQVTMRMVSPVLYQKDILIFTDSHSMKYQQLKKNPYCAIGIGYMFAEVKAEFLGATMLDANEDLRRVYDEKFPHSFDEGVPLGGREAEFILLKPLRLTGWAFDEANTEAEGIPTLPFDIDMEETQQG